MAQPASQADPATTTENPLIAVGRKVKSALSSQQQPSIRILRENSSNRRVHRKDRIAQAQYEEAQQPPYGQSQFTEDNRAPVTSNDASNGARLRGLFQRKQASTENESNDNEYDADMVDMLDVMDPEVSTLSTLTNVQNSLFVPSLGKIVNRRPAYRMSESPEEARTIDKLRNMMKRIKNKVKDKDEKEAEDILGNAQYAVLPDGERLEGWTREDKEELDDLVRHMLHSRRAKFKRAMKGFGQYVRRPLGLFITVYATLITLFGAAWVFFLIGWISLGSKQDYVVNVVDNVLVALFAIIGDGLAPFRAVDTYHMIYIAHYHRKTWKRRDKLGLPDLVDRNDLPEQRKAAMRPTEVDLESLVARRMGRGLARRLAPRIPKKYAGKIVARGRKDDPGYEYTVLNEEEQAKLEYHERKFSKSHTFYKPHETETHYAFPLKLLITVVILLDCHSALQITLGACTWGISYHTRPFALTTVILCFSITCNIMAGVLISRGDKKTRKHEVIERMMRQELTQDAIDQIAKRQMKEAEERGEIHPSVRKKLEEEKEQKENEEIKKSWKSVPSLPKKLLGKGEDHRQPSLPQEARRSSSAVQSPSSSSTSVPRKPVPRNSAPLQSVHEGDRPLPAVPGTVHKKGDEVPKQGRGQRAMAMLRKADLDRS